MTHFKLIGLVWLVFGGLGSLYTCWHADVMFSFVYLKGGIEALAFEILGCLFTLTSALAGFGLLRHWRWARIAIEVLGSVLLTYSAIMFLFVEVDAFFGLAAGFSLYSVLIALFARYESPPNTARACVETPAR